MGWLKKIFERLKVRKPVPVIIDKFESIQIDDYLWDLVDKTKTRVRS